MNITITNVLWVIALILFVLAAVGVDFGASVNFVAAGLAFLTAGFLARNVNT